MKDLIGVLDSGMGGVSVLRTATRLLPCENFLYYGDNKHAPYGPRSTEEIVDLSARAVEYLESQGVKALLIACNTITAAYAATLRARANYPVIGMEPAVKPASLARSGGKVLALATRATLRLDKFQRLMDSYGEGVIPVEGAGLVELVEAGKADSGEAREALAALFAPYMGEQIDAIVLGCTHYPFLRRQIEPFFPGARIFDGREGTVRELKHRLEAAGLISAQTSPGAVRMETSGGPEALELMRRLYETDV